MIPLWFRLSSATALIFALMIAGILVQPRDTRPIHTFFEPPPDCAAPCFLGIRPGVTTDTEADAILSAQPWVGKLIVSRDNLYWAWNGQQPAFITQQAHNFKDGQISFARGLVASISVSTEMTWDEFRVVFGIPDAEIFVAGLSRSGYFPFLFHSALYRVSGLEVDTNTYCPLKSRDDLWYSTVTMVMPIHPSYDMIPVENC
ncbi:MAG: hypothetical protein ABI700_29490 [Chloroflexota bacterium]